MSAKTVLRRAIQGHARASDEVVRYLLKENRMDALARVYPRLCRSMSVVGFNHHLKGCIARGNPREIQRIYSDLVTYSAPNAVTYNLVMQYLVDRGDVDGVWRVWSAWRGGLYPNGATYAILFPFLGKIGEREKLLKVEAVWKADRKGYKVWNTRTYTALLQGWLSILERDHRMIRDALDAKEMTYRDSVVKKTWEHMMETFSEMRPLAGVHPNVRTWTVMLRGAAISGDVELALKWFKKLTETQGRPEVDLFTCTNLLHALVRYTELSVKGVCKFEIIYNKMLSMHGETVSQLILRTIWAEALLAQDRPQHAINEIVTHFCYRQLDDAAVSVVCRALMRQRNLSEAMAFATSVAAERGYPLGGPVYTVLIAAHARRGRLGTALRLWYRLVNSKDSSKVKVPVRLECTASAVIHALGRAKKGSLVLQFWNRFVNTIPDTPSQAASSVSEESYSRLSSAITTALGRSNRPDLLVFFSRRFLGQDYFTANQTRNWFNPPPVKSQTLSSESNGQSILDALKEMDHKMGIMTQRGWAVMVAAWARCGEYDECLRLVKRGWDAGNGRMGMDRYAWDVVRKCALRAPSPYPQKERARLALLTLCKEQEL